jgi:hypothetical protein
MSLDQLIEALGKLNDASSAAQKYGPFYFALFLLLFVPFIASSIIKRSAENANDEQTKSAILAHYNWYFNVCLTIGALCTVAGVVWWFYDNYRQSALIDQSLAALKAELSDLKAKEADMQYTTVGYIENTTGMSNQFINTLGHPSIVFSPQGGPENRWVFAVMSDQPIQPARPLQIELAYTDPASGKQTFWPLGLPVQASSTPIAYRFTIDQDGAHIEPAPR